MKPQIALLIALLLLVSCNKTKGQSKTPKNKTIAEVKAIDSQENEQLESRIKIKFLDFSITIDSLEAFDEKGVLKEIQKDTAIIYLEYGERIEGKRVIITQSKFTNVEIYQRYENSMTILKEGPHCDLTEWKHYNSEWEILKNVDNLFIANTYTKEDRKKFIPTPAKELIKAVEDHCGTEWSQLITDHKNQGDYSIRANTSRIFLKIVLQLENGEKQEKIISFILPMGC